MSEHITPDSAITLHSVIEVLHGKEWANDGGNMGEYLNIKDFLTKQMELAQVTPKQMLMFYKAFKDEGCIEEILEALAGYIY